MHCHSLKLSPPLNIRNDSFIPWHHQQAWCKQHGENCDKKPSLMRRRGSVSRWSWCEQGSGVLEDSRRAKTWPRNRLGQPEPGISFPGRCHWADPDPGYVSSETRHTSPERQEMCWESWELCFICSHLCLNLRKTWKCARRKVLCSLAPSECWAPCVSCVPKPSGRGWWKYRHPWSEDTWVTRDTGQS